MSMLSVFFNFGASFSSLSLSLSRSLLDRAVAIVSIPLALKGNQIHERDCCTMCVCYGSCFVASVRHYIFIEIESLLLLSSLDVVAVGQVGISSTFFFFFSFLFSLFSHSLLLSSFKPRRRRSRFLFYAEAQTLFSCSPFPRESSLHSKSS